MTSPDRAAEIIHRGIAAGRVRIMVGPDARLTYAAATLMPTHYADVMRIVAPRARRVLQRLSS
jgi:hypothetical protein